MYIIVTIKTACGPHCFFTAHMTDLESLGLVVPALVASSQLSKETNAE